MKHLKTFHANIKVPTKRGVKINTNKTQQLYYIKNYMNLEIRILQKKMLYNIFSLRTHKYFNKGKNRGKVKKRKEKRIKQEIAELVAIYKFRCTIVSTYPCLFLRNFMSGMGKKLPASRHNTIRYFTLCNCLSTLLFWIFPKLLRSKLLDSSRT